MSFVLVPVPIPYNPAVPGPIGGTTPNTGAFTTLSATGQISGTKTSAAQAVFSGWDSVGGASTQNGAVELGTLATAKGVLHYESSLIGKLYLDNTYDNSAGSITLRLKTAGTPLVIGEFNPTQIDFRANTAVIGTLSATGEITGYDSVANAVGTLNLKRNITDASYSGGVDWSYIYVKDNTNAVLAAIRASRPGATANKKANWYFTAGGTNDVVIISSSGLAVTGTLSVDGIVTPGTYTTGTRPTKTLGGIIFDTTLNKLLIGGASAWEVVTSI